LHNKILSKGAALQRVDDRLIHLSQTALCLPRIQGVPVRYHDETSLSTVRLAQWKLKSKTLRKLGSKLQSANLPRVHFRLGKSHANTFILYFLNDFDYINNKMEAAPGKKVNFVTI
jgi:hypothetical protein